MAGEMLNMCNLTVYKYRCKLKVLCFKNRHKLYTQGYANNKKQYP